MVDSFVENIVDVIGVLELVGRKTEPQLYRALHSCFLPKLFLQRRGFEHFKQCLQAVGQIEPSLLHELELDLDKVKL